MYNQNLKERFLSSYDSSTVKTYTFDLERISVTEEQFGKDLFNFTLEQIDEALKSIQFRKKSSVERAVSTYRMYASWANQEGFVPSKVNLWELLTSEKLDKYVWEYALENSYITREELFNDIIPNIANSLDYVPILLVYEGVYGQKFEELINLTYKDIDFETGKVTLRRNDGAMRDIIIKDKRTLNLLEDASDDNIYYKDNGMSDARSPESQIIITPYVIRKTTRKKVSEKNLRGMTFNNNQDISPTTISARFAKVFRGYRHPNPAKNKDPFVDGYTFLNATNVFKSGYFDYCLKLERKYGELETKHYEQACYRYGINLVLIPSYKAQYLDWKSRLKL